ncbi:protein of unknown function [Candidatus Nitrospira inopinata]|uniref:Uncharacterized protein n=1 Tax=Candidatus Nitrospira inopinata TaxID=1715989 RepID=A0A0S4KUA0_9BACT|nr:protein of unknown function [Candidatus Nitrospira inopinata]
MGFRPEEKGIKTPVGRVTRRGLDAMGFRPEEKGIKTSQRGVNPAALRWDSDLKKKGLRRNFGFLTMMLRVDGIPT